MGSGVFAKAFAGGFIGKFAGALFIAICIALGIGPDKWAKFVVTGLPAWLTPERAQMGFIIIAVFTFIALTWPLLLRIVTKLQRGIGNKKDSLQPVAIQELQPLSRLEDALILKSIHVGCDELVTKGQITIDISMRNSSGITLRNGNVIGHIEFRPMVSMPQWLPSPTFPASTTNNIPPRSDFHIILVQKFPEEARNAATGAWDQGRVIQLNFSELQISVNGNGDASVILPLWYGATVEKIGGRYITAELGNLQKAKQ